MSLYISIIFILIGAYMFYFAIKKMRCSKAQDLVLLFSVLLVVLPSNNIILSNIILMK